MYECSSFCTCDKRKCSLFKLEMLQLKYKNEKQFVIQHTESKGYGLFAQTEFVEGDYVIEYVGEMIRLNEANRRVLQYKESGVDNYMLEVREHFNDALIHTCIDATMFSNESRFINHSCDPNCSVHIV